MVRRSTGLPLPLEVKGSAGSQKNAICFSLPKNGASTKDEAYTLDVTTKNIVIRAKGAAGLFYGSQALRQLLPAGIENTTRQTGSIPLSPPCTSATSHDSAGVDTCRTSAVHSTA